MIADLLPKYYEYYKNDIRYNVVHSIVVEGHEVAWVNYTGTIKVDLLGLGREGSAFSQYAMMCECNFTEGVGWIVEGRQVVGTSAYETCPYRDAAIQLRHLELRKEYEKRFGVEPGGLRQAHIREVVLDLIDRSLANEWLEANNGAALYGGHFYYQTVASIMGVETSDVLEVVDQLVAEEVIHLEGTVVKSYSPPPSPKWKPCFTVEIDGWRGKVLIPKHRRMPQEWRFKIFDPDGKKVKVEHEQLAILHPILFGPDAEDSSLAQKLVVELIDIARGNA